MGKAVSEVARQALDRCLCKRTRAAARAITRVYEEELRSTGLRPSQVELLAAVAANPEFTISALADELGMDRTTMTRNLRPLEKRGLIGIMPEGRYRARPVYLTPTGEAVLSEAIVHWERAQALMERGLGEKGVASVRRATGALMSASAPAG